MTNATNHTILVIGSTGKTGSRVADQLEKRGIPVRRGSRTADSPFDWDAHRQGAARENLVEPGALTEVLCEERAPHDQRSTFCRQTPRRPLRNVDRCD